MIGEKLLKLIKAEERADRSLVRNEEESVWDEVSF